MTINNWYGRSLENYKAMHMKNAQAKKVGVAFAGAVTLTKARKILWGEKKKAYTCCTSGCGFTNCPRATRGR